MTLNKAHEPKCKSKLPQITVLQNSLRRVMRCTSPCTRPRGAPGTLWWSPQAVMTQRSTRTVTTLGTGWMPPSTSVQYTLSVIGLTSGEFICSVNGWLQLPCRKDMYLLYKYYSDVIAYNLLISPTEEIHVFVFIIQFVLHVCKDIFFNFQHSSCECPERNLV